MNLVLGLVYSGHVEEAEQGHGGPDVWEGVLQLAGDPQGGVAGDVNLKH